MLYLPPSRLREFQHNLQATPNDSQVGTVVTASGTVHVKGTYVDLIASTNFDVRFLWLTFHNTATAATLTDVLVDIAIAAPGAANTVGEVILPNFTVGWGGAARWSHKQVGIPFFVPKGVAIRARAQSRIANDTVVVYVAAYGGDPLSPAFRGCDALGIDTVTSRGTSVTPGATAGTEGAWTNIGGPTSRPYSALFPLVHGGLADTTLTNSGHHWEVGIGGTILGEWYCSTDSDERIGNMVPPLPLFQEVPSGTQLQARAEFSAGFEPHDMAIYALY